MGSLFGSLASTAESMRAIERSMEVVQNNVTNASTPGYARQTQVIVSNRFNPAQGLPGGITAKDTLSARNSFAETAVRNERTALGASSQKASDLVQVEQIFTVTDGSGINGALSDLFTSFSQLTVSPNDASSRQVVLDRAQAFAGTINAASANLGTASTSLNTQASSTMDHINKLAGQIANLNKVLRDDISSSQDSGLDAQLHSALEELSKLANFTAIHQPDGSVSVYLGGQTPLVLGAKQYQSSAGFQNGGIQINNEDGVDITSQITGGQLGGLLEEKNSLFPAYTNDLNTLASSVANRVNAILQGGVDQTGAAPATDLFTYNSTLGAAATLRTNTLTPSQLAAAKPSAPGGNGNALDLSTLSSSKEINGYSFTEFYGTTAAKVGRDLSNAKNDQQSRQQLLDQATSVREQVSGVNLDEEAAHLIVLQRGYQAAAKMLTVLNDMTGTVLDLLK